MAQRKRILKTNRKFTKKTSTAGPLAALSSKTELSKEISNSIELESKIIDDDKNVSNNKTFNFYLLNDNVKELKFSKKSDQITFQCPSSSELTDQLSKPSTSLNTISDLRSVIDKVRKLQLHPSVHIYSITPEGKGMSAVDVSQNLSHLAYSFPHSHEIRLCARKNLSGNIARRDLRSTWLNFISARNEFTEVEKSEEEKSECLASPQEHYFIHKDDVSGLCFSSDDSLLMSCSLDGSAKVISTTSYCVLKHYSGYGLLTGIDINSGTTQFVTTNVLSWKPFHAAYLYSFERKDPILCFSGHTNSIKTARFHPNGLYIATASSDKSIKLWSIQQSKEVRNFKDEETDHPEKIAFSPDGKCIASSYNGCIKIWDIASGRKLQCLKISNSKPCILNICYNFEGNMLAAGGSDKQIHFWNIKSNESSEMSCDCDFIKSECLNSTIFSIKYVSNFFSCVTG